MPPLSAWPSAKLAPPRAIVNLLVLFSALVQHVSRAHASGVPAASAAAAAAAAAAASAGAPWPIDFTFAQAQVTAGCLHKFADDLMAMKGASVASADSATAAAILDRMQREAHSRLPLCRLDHKCKECLNATTLDPRVPSCEAACKDSAFCEQACRQLRNLAMNRPGGCPTVRDPRQETCESNGCSSDLDCVWTAGTKCCDTGLCRTCQNPPQQPVADSTLPVAPSPVISGNSTSQQHQQQQHQQHRHLEWDVASAVSLLDPVIYIVQARYMIGPRFEPRRAGGWRVLQAIAENSLRLDEPLAGHFYQFRVAAVSARGTRGFGPPSAPYAVSREPSPPSAPSDLSEGRMRVYSSGRVSVTVHWLEPKRIDMEVTQYQITWSKDYGFVNSEGHSVLSVLQLKRVVPGDSRSCLIEDLEPATSYKVEVRAATVWGSRVLISPPNSIYVLTLQADHQAADAVPQAPAAAAAASSVVLSPGSGPQAISPPTDAGSPSATVCAPQALSASQSRLVIRRPRFEAGGLSVELLILGDVAAVGRDGEQLYRVQWRRRVCIDMGGESRVYQKTGVPQGEYFKIDNLHFNCRYSVRLVPMPADSGAAADQQQSLGVIEACFSVPPCSKVVVASGSDPPACDSVKDAPTPEEPRDVAAQMLSSSAPDGSLAYRISWLPPRQGPHSVSAYRIVWGPRKEEPISQEAYSPSGLQPQMDTDRAISLVVRKENTSLVIRHLTTATLYIVKLRTHSFYKSQLVVSPEKTFFFETPGKKSASIESLYQQSVLADADVRRYVKINSWSNGKASNPVRLSTGTILASASLSMALGLLTSQIC